MGRGSLLSFLNEWQVFPLSHSLFVNSSHWQVEEHIWKVASADNSMLKAVLKREHSVPSTTESPLTGARCFSLTPPSVKANSEALFKKQLLRGCTISWNDPLTFLPLLISKQWIIKRTRADCTAHFFRSQKPAPYIPVRPKRDSLIKWVCSKARGSCFAPLSYHMMEQGKRTAHDKRWIGQRWSKRCPSFASLKSSTQLSQDLSQRSCSTGSCIGVCSIIGCHGADLQSSRNSWVVGRSRVIGTEKTLTILLQSLLQSNTII